MYVYFNNICMNSDNMPQPLEMIHFNFIKFLHIYILFTLNNLFWSESVAFPKKYSYCYLIRYKTSFPYILNSELISVYKKFYNRDRVKRISCGTISKHFKTLNYEKDSF